MRLGRRGSKPVLPDAQEGLTPGGAAASALGRNVQKAKQDRLVHHVSDQTVAA